MLRLGVTTDTQDMSGAVLTQRTDEEVRAKVTPALLQETIRSFVGDILQIPPMYSAIKIGGKKLYELARAGKTIAR